jgi:phosphoribosylaminoimidazolecarboxamide formyltransferase/IMP cyclohydrolase
VQEQSSVNSKQWSVVAYDFGIKENILRHLSSYGAKVTVVPADATAEDPRAGRVVTKRAPTDAEFTAMAFGLKVVKHVKSNAIAFVEPHRTLALGGGATSRVDPVHAARDKAGRVGISLRGSVWPVTPSSVPGRGAGAAKAGAVAVVQPGGSVRDDDVIAAADALGLAMVFTGVRHFRH